MGCFWTDFVGCAEDCADAPPGPAFVGIEGEFYSYLDIYVADPVAYPDTASAIGLGAGGFGAYSECTGEAGAGAVFVEGNDYFVSKAYLIADVDSGCSQHCGPVPSEIAWWPSGDSSSYEITDADKIVGVGNAEGLIIPVQMNQTFSSNGRPPITDSIIPMQGFIGAFASADMDAWVGDGSTRTMFLKIDSTNQNIEPMYVHVSWSSCF